MTITKQWTQEEIKHLLSTNDKMVAKSLIKLYECQTHDEQKSEDTIEANGIGFNGCDAYLLTSISKWYLQHGYLSPKQLAIVRKKIMKYAKQITMIANGGIRV